MREIFPAIIGNENIKKLFSEGIPAHAYIIEGPAGSGKHTIARQLCASMVCENRTSENHPLPCGTCPSCRKILGNISVDCLTISGSTKSGSIGVESVRSIRQSLYIAPNDGDRKFYIIEDAHKMTEQAQNALLLSLEEPPSFVSFFLLCESSQQILETIKSRAPVIKTELFSPGFIADHLEKKFGSGDREKIAQISKICGGSLGRAESLYDSDREESRLRRCAVSFCETLLFGKKSDAAVFASSQMPQQRNDVAEVLRLSRFIVRDIIAYKKNEELIFFNEGEMYPRESVKRITVRKLLAAEDSLTKAEDDITANCAVNTVLISLVMHI